MHSAITALAVWPVPYKGFNGLASV